MPILKLLQGPNYIKPQSSRAHRSPQAICTVACVQHRSFDVRLFIAKFGFTVAKNAALKQLIVSVEGDEIPSCPEKLNGLLLLPLKRCIRREDDVGEIRRLTSSASTQKEVDRGPASSAAPGCLPSGINLPPRNFARPSPSPSHPQTLVFPLTLTLVSLLRRASTSRMLQQTPTRLD